MNDDLYGQENEYEDQPAEQRDHLFLWTVGILLLLGVTFTSWLGSYYVFGHPENPKSYEILQKLKKIDPPKRYELTKAPPGEFLTPQKAYERYSKMSRYELERENVALARDYLKNYTATKRLVPYLTGRYTIMGSHELGPNDYFPSGVVALAQSVDFPQTVIEHIYPAAPSAVPTLKKMLATGLDIKLERLTDLAAVLHVTRLPDGRIQFTVVPLLYGSYALQQGSGRFSLEPPLALNPRGGLPIVREQRLEDSVKQFAAFSRSRLHPAGASPLGTPAIPAAVGVAETTIVRVPDPFPTSEETAAAAAASDQPPTPPPAPATAAATPSAAPEIPKALPAETPPAALAKQEPEIPRAVPVPSSSGGEIAVKAPQLQPFLAAANNTPTPATGGGNWRTFAPGQMPRGRLISLTDAAELADRGTAGERLYLRGNFVVTASRDSRAILRSSNRLGRGGRKPDVRVIVDFPAGNLPPEAHSEVARDHLRPFEIREIHRSNDGQINIFAREITSAE